MVSISSITPSIGGGMINMLIWAAAIIAVIGIVAYFIIKYWRRISYKLGISTWPHKVTIFEKRGDTHQTTTDKARRIFNKKEGMEKFQLLYRNEETEPIPFEYIYPTKKEGNQIILYSGEKGVYKPVKLNNEEE